MSRAVIQNSDYESVEAAKGPIDRHFADRNTYFETNSKRAGRRSRVRRPRRASLQRRPTARIDFAASSGSDVVRNHEGVAA
jgi:hypothetical protein